MKLSFIILAFLISACSSTSPKVSTAHPLKFEQIRALVAGSSTENEVIDLFGIPTNRLEKNGRIVINYNDPETGFQRLTIDISSESRKVANIIWIPLASEKEYFLPNAKAVFKNAQFKKIIDDNQNPHAISLPAISYIDEKSGVTIRYNQNQNMVEAIGLFDTQTRLPSNIDKKDKVPYTL